MKKLLPFLIILFFSYTPAHALEYTQTWGWWDLSKCISWVDIQVKSYTFWNVYNWWVSELNLQKGLHSYFVKRCWILVSWSELKTTITGIFVPIYTPKRWVIGFYQVYSGDSGTWIGNFYLSNVLSSNPDDGEKFIAGFYGGVIPYRNMSIKMKNEAYLASLNPPFSIAYLTQWYSYLGRPMLVARNNSWQVTNVFIQNPLSHKSQIEIAKKYLWEYWYHP